MNVLDKINLTYSLIATLLAMVLGEYWFLFAGLLICNIIDWLTGWYYAYINNKESSKVGAQGIIKKLGYWVVICIAFFIGLTFEKMGELIGVKLDFSVAIGWFVLASYLVNEIRSILENGVKLGWRVPEFLIRGLEVANKAIDSVENNRGGEL